MTSADSKVRTVTSEDQLRLARLLAEFEQVWDESALAGWVETLPPEGHPLRRPTLTGLVKIDLRLGWNRGRYLPLEDYLRRFPELGTPETVDVALVFEEYQARQAVGQPSDLVDFTRRFPNQAEALRHLIHPSSRPPSDAEIPSPLLKPNTSIHHTGPEVDPVLPEMFDRYRILKKLGQGGMGTVYLAHDTRLDRQVALKVPRFSPDQDRENLERFYREARATATIQHPNLCPLYDVGEWNGMPYLTMAYIEGASLARYIRADKPLPQYTVATVVRVVAQAVAEAHKRGVIHRDLKPGNIMINQRGEPIVMDFGLARWVNADKDDVRLTRNGAILGAPVYMSPEQVYGDVAAMGPCCDVYSLGVILYELLTGRLPFEGPTTAVLAKTLIQEPVKPSKYRPDIDPRLEAICLKAMAKKIDDRYQTMDELVAALTEYIRLEREARKAGGSGPLASKMGSPSATGAMPADIKPGSRPSWNSTVVNTVPTVNTPPPTPPQAITEARAAQEVAAGSGVRSARLGVPSVRVPRRPVWPWVVMAVLFLLTGGLIAGVVYVYTPPSEGTILITLEPCPPGIVVRIDGKVVGGLGAPQRLRPGKHELEVEGETVEPLRMDFQVEGGDNPKLHVPLNTRVAVRTARNFAGHTAAIRAVAITHGSHQAVTASADGTARLWGLENRTEIGVLKGHEGAVNAVAIFANQRLALTGGDDKTVRQWDLDAAKQLHRLDGHTAPVRAVAVSADGRRAVSGSDDRTVRVWDLQNPQKPAQAFKISAHDAGVTAVAISGDGQRILSGSEDRTARLWDGKGKLLKTLVGHTGAVRAVALLPDGRRALTASDDHTVRLWDLGRGFELKRIEGHAGRVVGLAVLADGKQFLSASAGNGDDTVRLWEVNSGRGVSLVGRAGEALRGVAVSPDGRLAMAVGEAVVPQLWDVGKKQALPAPAPYEITGERLRAGVAGAGIDRLAVSPDGKTALTAHFDGVVRLWDLSKGTLLKQLKGHTATVHFARFSPDGKRAVTASQDGTVRVWDLEAEPEKEELRKFAGHNAERVWAAVFTPDGKRVISGGDDNAALMWEVSSGVIVRSFTGHGKTINWLDLSPDGKRLLTASHDETVRVWEVDEVKAPLTLKTPKCRNATCAFLPDGRRAVTGGHDKIVRLWDTVTGKELRRFEGHTNAVWVVAVSPGGRRVLSSGADRHVNIWDVNNGRLLARFLGHPEKVSAAAFTPDGAHAVTGSQDGNLLVWDLPRNAWDPPPLPDDQARRGEELLLEGHTGPVESVAVSADGRYALSGGADGSVRYWDLQEKKELKRFDDHNKFTARCVALTPDGKRGLSAGFDKVVRYWDLDKGQALRPLFGHNDLVQGVAFSPDGKRALSCGNDRTVRLWDLETGEQQKQLDGHTKEVLSVAFLPRGKWAVSGGMDGTVRLWDLEAGYELSAWQLPSDVVSVAVSPDGKRVLAGCKNRLVYLLGVEGGLVLATFAGSAKSPAAVAFSPDGRWALSGGDDKALRLWDVETGREVGRFLGHTESVRGVAFTADGKYALTAGGDRTLRRWELPPFTAVAKP